MKKTALLLFAAAFLLSGNAVDVCAFVGPLNECCSEKKDAYCCKLASSLGYTPELFAPKWPVQMDFIWPTPTKKVTSCYGYRGIVSTPSGKGSSAHKGIDIDAMLGENVVAVADGIVADAMGFDWGGYGKTVIIKHAKGIETQYSHLSKVLVSRGQSVKAGQTIGLAGSTGKSTGPHLHFAVRKDGEEKNPLCFLDPEKSLHSINYDSLSCKSDPWKFCA